MAPAQRKKKGGKKRPRRPRPRPSFFRRQWLPGLVALAGVLLFLGLWLGGSRWQRRSKVVPPFEEQVGNDFNALLDQVEITIYHGLHRLGVEPSQVGFRKVVHRSRQGRQWDYAEVEVRLRPGQSPGRAQEIFAAELAPLAARVSWEVHQAKGAELVILIKVEGSLTHRLVFCRRRPRETRPEVHPRIAIVIDDLGYDGRLARRFLDIPGPLTFSVLPRGTFSQSIARRIHRAGHELLLHQPMEPKGYPRVNPGGGALLLGMTDAELIRTLDKNLDSMPYIIGVNNHMGSRFCEHGEKMRLVMTELKKRGLFFLDSRTTSRTRGYAAARRQGIPALQRDVFLDNIQSPEAIRAQLRRLLKLARLKGKAIGIAHPHEATLEVLRQAIPELSAQGVELVPLSELLK